MVGSVKHLDSMGRLLSFATRSVGALTSAMLAEHELTLSQWVALTALWQADGMTVTALARYTKSTVPATSRLVGRMEDQGLVERKAPKGDRRKVQVWLTKRSRGLSELLELYDQVNDRILEGFTAVESKRAAAYLERIIANATRHYAAHESDDPLVA